MVDIFSKLSDENFIFKWQEVPYLNIYSAKHWSIRMVLSLKVSISSPQTIISWESIIATYNLSKILMPSIDFFVCLFHTMRISSAKSSSSVLTAAAAATVVATTAATAAAAAYRSSATHTSWRAGRSGAVGRGSGSCRGPTRAQTRPWTCWGERRRPGDPSCPWQWRRPASWGSDAPWLAGSGTRF